MITTVPTYVQKPSIEKLGAIHSASTSTAAPMMYAHQPWICTPEKSALATQTATALIPQAVKRRTKSVNWTAAYTPAPDDRTGGPIHSAGLVADGSSLTGLRLRRETPLLSERGDDI